MLGYIIICIIMVIYSCYRFGIGYGLTLDLIAVLFCIGICIVKLSLCFISFIGLIIWWGCLSYSKQAEEEISERTIQQEKYFEEYGTIEDMK